MLVSEEYVNVTEGYRFGNAEPYEPHTEDVGYLFRAYRRDYGRCVSSIYVDQRIDNSDGSFEIKTVRVGWVFRGKVEYEDTHESYIREVWVTLHDDVDTVKREAHYHAL